VNEIIFIVHEPPEGGYAAEALGQPIFTVADTVEELNAMVRDAVVCHFEEEVRPKIVRLAGGAGQDAELISVSSRCP